MGKRRSVTRGVARFLVAMMASGLLVGLTFLSPAAGQDPVTLEGSVVYQNGPAAGLTVDLFEAGGDGSRSRWITDTTTGADGRFGFSVEPACYVLVAIAPEGRRFSTSRWEEIPICVDGPTTLPPARIQGDRPDVPGPAGTVRFTGGAPAEGVVVDLFQGARQDNRYLQSTRTDADGRYDFEVPDPANCYAVTIIAPEGTMFTSGSRWHNGGNCAGGLDAILADPDPQPGSCSFPVASDTWFSIVDESKVDLIDSDGRINVQHRGAARFDPATGGVQQSGLGMWFIGEYAGVSYFRSGFEIYTYDWDTGVQEVVPLVPGGEPFVHRPLLTSNGVIVYEGYASADDRTFGNVIYDIDSGTNRFLAPFGDIGTALGYDAEADRIDFSRASSYYVGNELLVTANVDFPAQSGAFNSWLATAYEDGRYTVVATTGPASLARWTYDYTAGEVEYVTGQVPHDGYTTFRSGTSPAVALDLDNQRLFLFGIATRGPLGVGASEPALWEMVLPTTEGEFLPVTPIGFEVEDNPFTEMTVGGDGRLYLSALDSLWIFDPAADQLTEYSGCVTPWSIAEVDGTVYMAALRADDTSATFRLD